MLLCTKLYSNINHVIFRTYMKDEDLENLFEKEIMEHPEIKISKVESDRLSG